jgi:hypothetical protein
VDQLLVSKFAKGASKKKVLASLIATYNKELSTIDAEEADDDDDDDHVSSRLAIHTRFAIQLPHLSHDSLQTPERVSG